MKKIISSCLFATCALIAAGNTPTEQRVQQLEERMSRIEKILRAIEEKTAPSTTREGFVEAERKAQMDQLMQIQEDMRRQQEKEKLAQIAPASVCNTRVSAFLKEHFGVQFGDPIEKFPLRASACNSDQSRMIPVVKAFQYFNKAIGYFDDGQLTKVEFFADLDKTYSWNSCKLRIDQACLDLSHILGLPGPCQDQDNRSWPRPQRLLCLNRRSSTTSCDAFRDCNWGRMSEDLPGIRRMGIWISDGKLSSRLRAEKAEKDASERRESEERQMRANAAGEELPAWK